MDAKDSANSSVDIFSTPNPINDSLMSDADRKIIGNYQPKFLPVNRKRPFFPEIVSDSTDKFLNHNQIEKSTLSGSNSLSESDYFINDKRDEIEIFDYLLLPDLNSKHPVASLSNSRGDIEIREDLLLPDLEHTKEFY